MLLKAGVLTLGLALVGFADARSKSPVREFRREVPCPVTGARKGPCPGYQVDHVIPLCAGGPDAKSNLQWLSVGAHKAKTREDVRACRQAKYLRTASDPASP